MTTALPNRRYDLIAFDWDGTLFDSTGLITRCIQEAVVEVGGARPSDAQASYVIGLNLMEALAHAAPDVAPEKYPQLGQAYRKHYTLHQDDISLFAGTLAMLQGLAASGHLIAVATGKSRSGLDDALGTVQLRGMFDATRTADETASKPHPMMLLELMRELGVAPERSLMIGDTTHDLQLAANAGTASVGVSYGAHEHASFAEFAPRHVAHSVSDLNQWLAEHA